MAGSVKNALFFQKTREDPSIFAIPHSSSQEFVESVPKNDADGNGNVEAMF